MTVTRRPTPLTDVTGAAEYLNVTERFVRELVYKRRIPFHKVGHLLRFRFTDLDQYLKNNRIEAQ